MTAITIHDLQLSYHEATKNDGLIRLVHQLRTDKTPLKLRHLKSYFIGNPLWIKTSQGSGHCKFTHKVTGEKIEYQNHGKEDIAPHIQEQIKNQVQKHLNILCNDIFNYSVKHWKTAPDYQGSLQRLVQRQAG